MARLINCPPAVPFYCRRHSYYSALEVSGGGIRCHYVDGGSTLNITECISIGYATGYAIGYWVNNRAMTSATQMYWYEQSLSHRKEHS